MIGYSLILITVAVIFPRVIYIDNSYYGIYALLAVLIIFILNRTIKPLFIWLTLPITALTLGLFYPVINITILLITSFVLQNHFQLHGIFSLFFVSIIISLMNTIMDRIIDNLKKED